MQRASPETGTPSLSAQPAPQATLDPSASDKCDMTAERTSDWAIASEKKSHALDRIFTVNALVIKWMSENFGKLSAVGWTTRKADKIFSG